MGSLLIVGILGMATTESAQAASGTGTDSTIGGGDKNEANNTYSTVGGGYYNEANGDSSTIGGGFL